MLGRVLRSPAGWLRGVGLAVAVVASGCGGSGSASPSAALASAAASSSSSRAAVDPQVLAGYYAEHSAYAAAIAIPDPDYPGLAETAVEPELSGVRRNLTALKQQGIISLPGQHEKFNPRVVSVERDAAIVLDCFSDPGVLTYKATGQPVPDQPGGPVSSPDRIEGVRATLTEVSPGRWKVSYVEVHAGSCPLGY